MSGRRAKRSLQYLSKTSCYVQANRPYPNAGTFALFFCPATYLSYSAPPLLPYMAIYAPEMVSRADEGFEGVAAGKLQVRRGGRGVRVEAGGRRNAEK